MRGIIALGVAWSILVCATPGLADRLVASPAPAIAQAPSASSPASDARVPPAADPRVACRTASLSDAGIDAASGTGAGTGSVIDVRYDPATDRPFGDAMTPSRTDANSTGLCR